MSSRQLSILDPKTMQYTFVDTCFGTHHLQFDKNNILWVSGSGPVAAWLDANMFIETGDAVKSQGWAPFVLDTNGNGKRDEWSEPGKPAEAGQGHAGRRLGPLCGDAEPGRRLGLVHIQCVRRCRPACCVTIRRRSSPSSTQVPMPGFSPRGGDIDSQGVVWVSLGSGHLGAFDRRKCKGPLNGPKATGSHCPEGWTFHQYPGPGFRDIGPNSAEASYYTWVDQHNAVGLGRDVPISTANLYDGFAALVNGEMVRMRIPYPWASTPRVSMRASTIRTPAGRAGACGARAATARPG